MARKADDLLADLDQLGIEEQSTPTDTTVKTSSKDSPSTATNGGDDDAFADLDAITKQLAAKPAAGSSRPSTPRLSSSTTSGTNKSPKRAEFTPASTSVASSGRNSSEDRARGAAQARTSGEGRSFHQGVTPEAADADPAPESVSKAAANAAAGGGWWGSMFSAASAAVNQAQTLAKEIQGNQEAQRWAEQVRGNLSNLQSIGTDLRTRALPTFTSLISHIAPPISAHERLQIHTTHDIQNYPSLDPIIYSTFSRVMSQVEGGDLMVIQRGSESRSKNPSEVQGYRGGVLGGTGSTWTDGPWWREDGVQRSLGTIAGLKEGTRLSRVSAESYAKEFFDARGGVEEAAKRATETLSETNPTRSSDIFLAIQAISYTEDKAFFAEDSHAEQSASGVMEPEEANAEVVVFAVYLYDPLHSLSFKTLSQPFPQRWAGWLDAEPLQGGLPDSITEIIHAGGVDPREWVAEWIEEILSLAVGVVAQQYVAKRMGVGEGGIGRGKKRAEEESFGGEAARAV